ncbi:MAG: DMT family transporter [Candidatus Lernaella stagnicola]|nr:DMT family transporter [Candidatus Lernaella stagnicola]
MRRSIDWRVHAALLWVQITFGGFHVFGKYVLEHVPPLAVAGIRILGATPLLFLLAWVVERRLPRWRDLPWLAALGFLGVFANQILFMIGLKLTTATNAAIMMPSIPVFTVAIAAAFGIERIGWRRAMGVGLAVAGALVVLNPFGFSLAPERFYGNLLILLNCLSYSGYLVLQRPVLKRLPPLTTVAWAFLFGGTGILLVSWPTVVAVDYGVLPKLVFVGLGYSVLIQTTINYALQMWAMDRSMPSLVSAYKTLQPISAALLAAVFLGEIIGWVEAAGFATIIGGLFLVTRVSNNRKGALPS